MLLRGLQLSQFRNFSEVELSFGAGFNVLSGLNGAGKTNLLEAIYLLSTLKSFRIHDQSALIREGASLARVQARLFNPITDLPETLEIRIERGPKSTRKRVFHNDKAQRSALSTYGLLRCILFTPEDMQIIRGSPTQRRQFIDRVLFADDAQHIVDIQKYEKLLRSRNRLLKEPDAASPAHQPLFSAYEEGLAKIGAQIWSRRVRLLKALNPEFIEHYQNIQQHNRTSTAPQSLKPDIRYKARVLRDEQADDSILPENPEKTLFEQIQKRRSVDILRKSTTIGPHLDDLEFRLNHRLAQQYASQGQMRTLILAFKIAELKHGQRGPHTPLLLLDDVSSELDPQRNQQLFSLLAQASQQCIMTTTDPAFIHIVDAKRHDFAVQEGKIATKRDSSLPEKR